MENTCRICLATDNLQRIFPIRDGMPNSNEIKLATGIEILEFCNFPKELCNNCMDSIKKCNQLRSTAEQSDVWLKKTYKLSIEKDAIKKKEENFDYFSSSNTSTFFISPIEDKTSANIKKVHVTDISNLKMLTKVENSKPKPEALRPLLPASVFKKITITPLFAKLKTTKKLVKNLSSPLEPAIQSTIIRKIIKPKILTRPAATPVHQKALKLKLQNIQFIHRSPDTKRPSTRFNWICEICGKVLKTNDRFQEHQNTHTNAKPFQCSQCPLRFNARNSLKRHLRVHSGQKPFCCKICSKTYSALHHLKSHMSEKHSTEEERKFRCNVCAKSFTFNFLLTAHMKDHSNVRKNININYLE